MKWIPFDWMKPDKSGLYLVTIGKNVYIEQWEQPEGQLSFEGNNKGRWRFRSSYEVSAWMPLPEPFKTDTPQTESTGSPIGDYRDGVGAWQTDRMTEEEIDTMLAKVLVGQTDCGWK